MDKMLRRFFSKIHESIWFIPSVYTVLASLLAFAAVSIDTSFNDEVKAYIPVYFRTSVDLAQTILGTISGALLTMTTITFSTIMVVLTMYSSQFSPRTLQNFLHAPSTQRVLGLFMGGFVYSILSLLFMRKQSISHEVISASLGVLIAVICLAFFAYFIHSVGNSVQVSRLIRELTDDVLRTLNQEHKSQTMRTHLSAQAKSTLIKEFPHTTEIESPAFGYVQFINYGKLTEWAGKNNAVIDITVPVGMFVGTQSCLARIYHRYELASTDIASSFTIGEERSILQDIEYGIEKISEIALRALSPGINDPHTAVRCIHSLGEVLQRASQLSEGTTLTYTNNHAPCLIVAQPSRKDYLYAAFNQISFYGKQDASVLDAQLEALLYIARSSKNSSDIKQDVHTIGEYIWHRFEHSVLEPLDIEKLENKRHMLLLFTNMK